MNQTLKDKMAKAIHRTIDNEVARGRRIDPIDLSERVLDAVELVHDMIYEESGIASVPQALQQEGPTWNIRKNAPAEPEDDRPHFMAPPTPHKSITQIVPPDPQAKRLIAMPGDSDFDKSKPAEVNVKPGVIKATMRRAPIRPASNSPAKQYWTEPEIIDAILKHTPEEIPFDIERADGTPFRIVAKRNVVNKQGLGGVALTYKDPRVGDGGNIELMAMVPFSLYDEQIDIEAGLTSIVAQLFGKYKDRSAGVQDPVAVGAPPSLGDYMRIGVSAGDVDMRIDRDEAGHAISLGGTTGTKFEERHKDEILQRVLDSSRRSNSSMVPKDSQLKQR